MKTATAERSADRLVRMPEAMRLTGLSRSTIYGLMEAGKLRHARLPGCGDRCNLRIPLSALESMIEKSMVGGHE